jgi:hypothetical protein
MDRLVALLVEWLTGRPRLVPVVVRQGRRG